jgi:hypothetical protein
MAEAGVAGASVVDRHARTAGQVRHHLAEAPVIGERRVLGNLKDQRPARAAEYRA